MGEYPHEDHPQGEQQGTCEHKEAGVAVVAGEMLAERQALAALLLPSADNMAWILARWDAGSQAAFAARMNADRAPAQPRGS